MRIYKNLMTFESEIIAPVHQTRCVPNPQCSLGTTDVTEPGPDET